MIFHNCKDTSFETVNLVTTKLSVKFTNLENKPCFKKVCFEGASRKWI